MSADTALRLERYFGSEAQGWLNLQSAYDLRVAEISAGKAIAKPSQMSEQVLVFMLGELRKASGRRVSMRYNHGSS